MSQTHHRGSILTGFPLSLPLIGTPGHLDGCRVGEMDAKTIRHVVEVYTIRGVCQARDHYLKEIPRLRFVHGRGSPRGVRPSHPVVFIGVRWPSSFKTFRRLWNRDAWCRRWSLHGADRQKRHRSLIAAFRRSPRTHQPQPSLSPFCFCSVVVSHDARRAALSTSSRRFCL